MEQRLADDEFKRKISLMPQTELEEFSKSLKRELKESEEKIKQLEEFKFCYQKYIQSKNQYEILLKKSRSRIHEV